jgi:hypothetical protein
MMLHLFSSAWEMKSGGCGGPNGMGFLPGLAFVLLGQRNTNESDRAWWQWLRRLCCTRSHSLKRRGGDSWLRVTYRFCKIRGNFAQRFTGSTFFIPQLNAKRFELVKESLPVRCSGSGAFKSGQSRKQTNHSSDAGCS